ncbi:contractile injection system tape measure protein [Yoonia sp. I 8.24]|uniref:contractile injection system tape measure protein n=1 Tax=Yoonia sp. I 8.24 TaxID=1537229 RepID=UPI001EE0FF40|nr:contractile injection system tape measure protein [Yoonia sp. I 8.24]MCG3266179.1 SAP domain-containing protein [Yoonia sp. I 8.24]
MNNMIAPEIINRIDTLEFDLRVTSTAQAVNSPDRLLLALRQEVLSTIDQVLDAAGRDHAPARITTLTLDIGQFDDPLDWELVRTRLRDGLVSAIHPYLTPRKRQSPRAAFAGQSLAQLKTMAAARGVAISGTKSALITRLVDHAASPWDFAAKTLKRAQSRSDLALFLTGQDRPSAQTTARSVARMRKQDIEAALRVASAEKPQNEDDWAACLARLICDDTPPKRAPAPRPEPEQSPIEMARARYRDFRQTGFASSYNSETETDASYARVISYLPSGADVDKVLKTRIPSKAKQLLQTITALDDAPDPLAAKRHILAALVANAPVDIAAARSATHDPDSAARAVFTRAMYALGDDITQAINRADALTDPDQPIITATDQPEAPCKQAFTDAIGPTAPDLLGLIELIYSALRPALPPEAPHTVLFWGHLVETILDKNSTQASDIINSFTNRLIPDAKKRDIALRATMARLNYPAVASATARAEARAMLETILQPQPTTAQPRPRGSTRRMTQIAGLILFHPYIAMLFDRLEIRRADTKINAEDLPLARAALGHLAQGETGYGTAADPLYDCLLGRPSDADALPSHLLTPANHALIDGLVQSVIAQWGRLGNTSPDGLRSAFVQRGGVMDLDDPTQPKLTVNKGAYDMLLDGLPWAFNVIALPWMPAPLHVDWRQRDD